VTHPLFARLDEQLRLAEAELDNLHTSHAKAGRLKAKHPELYDEWTHRAALAEGIRSVYAGLESVMKAIADEIDHYEPPKAPDWHEKLIDQLAVRVDGVREALLDPGTKALLHELRRFRHVVHHNYAQKLEMNKVLENYQRLTRAFAAFARDYRRLAEAMQAPEK
jgi:hypothetical protein